jgi:multiple antibiotic resistance protein
LTIALTVAWLTASIILLCSTPLHRILGPRGLSAVERLMGMILVMMSVQMMLNAVQTFDFNSVG